MKPRRTPGFLCGTEVNVKKTLSNTKSDTDHGMAVSRGDVAVGGSGGPRGVTDMGVTDMGTEGDVTLRGKHTMQ